MEIIQILTVFVTSAVGTGAFLKFFAEKIVDSELKKALHRDKLLAEADLEFRKRQLEEFYGPIYASLKLSSEIYPLWIGGKLKEVNHDVINLFKRQNDEITMILKTKTHLMDGEEFPPEFIKFMTSATIWGMYCTRPEHPYIPDHVSNLDRVKWPKEFENHIYAKTEELKKKLDSSLVKYRAK